MNFGTFSLSLCVSDLQRSRAFYEKLGFETLGDYSDQGWLMMRSPTLTLGLFEKFIEKNTLTFNPGWDENAQELEEFTDVRELQKQLKAQGIELHREADESGEGPEHFVVIDPDGNPILVDQHR
ncbi:MAG: VOC family protein [Wenzhouxiangella sp.]|jgi:catechol 2,3-dioxygenase-like lactoylglutathione lyase family enzyme|nr:VOC family protein [Wenzhouxiangella sp.]